MHGTKPRRGNPEYIIQQAIIVMLKQKGWHIEVMHASALMEGIPDLFVGHPDYGMRWIEVKNLKAYHFTVAQQRNFPIWSSHGIGIWILVSASKLEYMKLFKKPNWTIYLNPKMARA